MPKGAAWLSLAGFFGLVVAADAQTPLSQTASSQFDGTYAFVSSTKLTEMYTVGNGRMRPCPDWTVGPLTIERGQARVPVGIPGVGGLVDFDGTVGSQGELAVQSVQVTRYAQPAEKLLRGRIDGIGTVRARTLSGCNFDFVWRK